MSIVFLNWVILYFNTLNPSCFVPVSRYSLMINRSFSLSIAWCICYPHHALDALFAKNPDLHAVSPKLFAQINYNSASNDLLQRIKQFGADPNCYLENDWTPLMAVSVQRIIPAVKLLLANGARVTGIPRKYSPKENVIHLVEEERKYENDTDKKKDYNEILKLLKAQAKIEKQQA